jgi:hypothetical protein
MIEVEVFQKLPSLLKRADKVEAALTLHLKGVDDAELRSMLHRLRVCIADFSNGVRR